MYVFFSQAKLDAYLASELFSAQSQYPHVSEVTYEVHDVIAGTEKSIENFSWGHTPPTRALRPVSTPSLRSHGFSGPWRPHPNPSDPPALALHALPHVTNN